MLSRAFKDGMKDLFPDPEERRRKEPLVSELHLRLGYSFSEVVITSPGMEGIAVWMHSDRIQKRTFKRILGSGCLRLALRIGLKALQTMNAHDEYTWRKHRKLVPGRHWYLAVLAVDPKHWGRGYARQLLDEGLRRVDRDNLPCYLETEGEKNASMYRRFGFDVIDEFVAPGSNEATIAMLRNRQKA